MNRANALPKGCAFGLGTCLCVSMGLDKPSQTRYNTLALWANFDLKGGPL